MTTTAAGTVTGGRLSRLTQITFYAPDLNKIAETVRRNQQLATPDPTRPSDQLYATPEGEILTGTVVDPSNERLSRITQETFYSDNSTRLVAEQLIAREKMPAGTVYATDGTYEGWVYTVTNEFADVYQLFLWYDPSVAQYKVSLISPPMAGNVSAHGCHLFSDGTLCLRTAGGYPEMERAYARSVLWTRGASCYQRGYGFQFSKD
jgi:hypothetical protein